jgi:hypothetical protein
MIRQEHRKFTGAPKRDTEWDTSLSDGCTLVPDRKDMVHCCVEHDRRYWLREGSRSDADAAYRTCIIEAGRPVLARVHWLGVRIFGWLFWHT